MGHRGKNVMPLPVTLHACTLHVGVPHLRGLNGL